VPPADYPEHGLPIIGRDYIEEIFDILNKKLITQETPHCYLFLFLKTDLSFPKFGNKRSQIEEP